MSDQVEAELKSLGTQALQDLMNNLTQAKGFVLEQAPEFCQQLVARGMAMRAMDCIGPCVWLLVALIMAVCCWAAAWKYRKSKWLFDDPPIFGLGLVGAPILTAAIAISSLMNSLRGYIAISVAPKVYLVEEIARMLK